MSPERIDEMLGKYRLCVGKAKHLEIEIKILQKRIEKLQNEAIGDAALSCQHYNDMPHGSGISDATGRVAIQFADGYKPQYISDNENDLKVLIDEKEAADAVVHFVDAWLQCLNEQERYIVERKMIDGESWRIVADEFGKRFGTAYSKEGVKRIRDRALCKIYLMAS